MRRCPGNKVAPFVWPARNRRSRSDDRRTNWIKAGELPATKWFPDLRSENSETSTIVIGRSETSLVLDILPSWLSCPRNRDDNRKIASLRETITTNGSGTSLICLNWDRKTSTFRSGDISMTPRMFSQTHPGLTISSWRNVSIKRVLPIECATTITSGCPAPRTVSNRSANPSRANNALS